MCAPSLSCHITYYQPWFSLENGTFIEPDKFIHKKIYHIDLLNSFVVYTYLYLLKTLHLINKINHSLFVVSPAHTFRQPTHPIANSHNEQHQVCAAPSPPSLPAGKPTLLT